MILGNNLTYLIAIILLILSYQIALASSEVIDSNILEFPVGTIINDDAIVVIPQDSKIRVLVIETGSTKTIKGPYEGTISGYREERSWWERITGRSRYNDAPIGANRGLLHRPGGCPEGPPCGKSTKPLPSTESSDNK